MRRKDKALSPEIGLEIIDKSTFASLACVDLEGLPYVVNLNMVRVNDCLYFHSATSGFKVDCFKKNDKVCVSFVDSIKVLEALYSTRYRSSIVRGTISLVEDYDEKYLALKALTMKFCPNFMAGFDKCATSSISHTAIYKIKIEDMTVKGNDLNEE